MITMCIDLYRTYTDTLYAQAHLQLNLILYTKKLPNLGVSDCQINHFDYIILGEELQIIVCVYAYIT